MQVERQETTFLTYIQIISVHIRAPFKRAYSPNHCPATYTIVLGSFKDVVINKQVITQEIKLVLHVLEKTTNKSSQVNDMGRLVLFKDCLGVLWLSARVGNRGY
jgi:hypothetical protein